MECLFSLAVALWDIGKENGLLRLLHRRNPGFAGLEKAVEKVD
jgi:hypothetical protein